MPRRNYWLILGAVVVAAVCYQTADHNPLGRSFSEVADLVERRFVGQVDRSTLWSGAVRGMLSELGDPYSQYIDPKEAAQFEEMLSQEFGGIGIQLDPRSNKLTVLSPIVGSPAYRAGILSGDVVIKIDGHSTGDMKFAEATSLIRGKPGEPVQLSVERPGKSEPIDLPPIKREIINVDSVLGDARTPDGHWNYLLRRDPNIGYIRIVNFGERTAGELKAALATLRDQGLQGLVLDLRNNPGGLLRPAAIGVCDLFLPAGKPIVSTRGRDGQIQEQYLAGGGEKFLDFPLAVLINEGSASASEIVAACLQDNGRAVIIGQRSYGKGTVQNVIPLHGDLGVLKLTTAGYWRPNGQNIQRRDGAKDSDQWGVSPDTGYDVKLSKEDVGKWKTWRQDRDLRRPHEEGPSLIDDLTANRDRTLSKAVSYLESQISSAEKK